MANYRKIELTGAFGPEEVSKLEVGQTLTFVKDDIKTTYKIVKIIDSRIWSKMVTLFRPEDVVFGDKDNERIYGKWKNKAGK